LAVATTDGVTLAVTVGGSGAGGVALAVAVTVAATGVGVLVTALVPPLQLVSTITTAIAQIR